MLPANVTTADPSNGRLGFLDVDLNPDVEAVGVDDSPSG